MNAILPGYHISQQIYESANSLVYRATREHDGRPVILKVLKPDYPNLAALSHYNQEYEIIRRLNVPGVVKTYGLEPYRNTLVLVLEDFGGVSIREWLARAGNAAVPLIQCLEIVSKIAAGLDQIHTSGVFHKNVNPSNVVFNQDTGILKLIDFGLATTLSRETPMLNIPQGLEGTLAYLSPEQSGRMNRTVDYRTDFYSLGVLFYELLTGRLPFEAADILELVHAHLAKSPVAPHELDPTIPRVVSALVLKLMEKAPEDRYQSAQGIKHDLDLCLQQVQSGQIPGFEPGERDWTDHFLIPEKLYGRDAEIKKLITAFERVAHGSTELMLVTGFSGVGKTAVINEIHTPIVRQRGYFIKGKFDQLGRSIPFSAFVQAFRDLMGQLLSEGQAQCDRWRAAILSALGESAQVINEVIPELERIIGPQPPVPELTGSAVQNRFNLLFQRFIAVFTTAEHPLVIFLDDLQWADLASLKLMQLLMSETATGYLLLLGAYRDNEVSPVHPLMMTLDEIGRTGAKHNIVRLEPLGQADINRLIADTLSCSPEITRPLTRLVYQKTQGNPFFNNQFLKALYEEKLITFDFAVGHWQFDIAQVSTLALTEDVIEFMTLQLQKLPAGTQEALKVAACIGNWFDLETLAIIHQQSEIETAANLWEAVKAGVVLPQGEVYEFVQARENASDLTFLTDARAESPAYRFLHDRVQQAAYALIPEAQRPTLHLTIGRLLLSKTQPQQLEERLFEIISQFNAGLSQVASQSERDTLAHLNLQAGQKAKAATAYAAAMDYLIKGASLLPSDCWQTCYSLTLSLYSELVEVAYLTGNFEQMEQVAREVLQQATTLLDKVRVYEVQIQAEIARNQLKAALQLGLSVLYELDTTFPEQPGQAEIENALQRVPIALAGKPIPGLLHLPPMTDPVSLATMRIMFSIGAPAYLVEPPLFPLLIVRQLIQSINYGNTAASVYAYASYGMLLCGVLGDIESGHEFGLLALNLLPHLKAKEVQARTYFTYYTFIHHWKSAIVETLSPLLEGYHSGLETGDLEFASYSISHRFINAFFTGYELNALARDIATFRAAIHSFHQENPYYYLGTCQQAVLNLLGKSYDPCVLVGDAYDEMQMLPQYKRASDITALHNLFIHKMILCTMFGDYEQAVEHASQSGQYAAGVPGIIAVVLHHFYDSLARLSIYDDSEPDTQTAILQQVAQNQEKLQQWAASAPMNYRHKFELVEAERYRVLGEPLTAMDWYDRAITSAKENGFLQEEALANEFAARFYLGLGKEKIAQIYIQAAYHGYSKWGAAAKTAHLERLYAPLLTSALSPQKQQFSLVGSPPLDLVTIIKASQAIAGQIELDHLLKAMIQIAIENAGAQRAVLLLEKDSAWVIEAVGSVDSHAIQIVQTHDFSESDIVPMTLIDHVARTRQDLVFDDVAAAQEFAHDPYIKRHNVKSVLCVQLVNRGCLVGILYLENNLTTRAFTVQRLELLDLLASQMAISLDNAHLYASLEAKVTERTRQLEFANRELASFAYSVSHDLRAPLRSIDGFSQALLEDYESALDAEGQDYLRRVRNASQRMEQLIDHLLKLSRISRQEMQRKIVNLSALAREIAAELAQADPGRDIVFSIAEEITVMGDADLLRVVLNNLMSNAWKFTGKRAQAVIQFYDTIYDNEHVYVIKDNGAGFDMRYANKLFGAFQRLHQQTEFEGTGIGLATVQRIIHRHGGRIWAEAALDEGATFYFTLG